MYGVRQENVQLFRQVMQVIAQVSPDVRKVCFISLGCARNLVDSEVMMGKLLERGWGFSEQPQTADAVVVNTCGFIEAAKQESIAKIMEVVGYKQQNPDLRLIVAGCLSQRYGKRLQAGIPEVDLFVGTDQFHRIAEYLDSPLLDGKRLDGASKLNTKRTNYIYTSADPKINTLSPYSAYVKVSEGCQHRCAFCVIPVIRGGLRSRTVADVGAEAEQLAEQGVAEIILIAQDLAAFGRDRQGSELLPLLRRLVEVKGLRWIRLLYIYPEYIDAELLDLLASEDKIVKYLDIPVQHASDRILQRMRRAVNRQDLERIFSQVRERIPDVALRTSVMVGFPSESEDDFNMLLDFVSAQEFDHLGCFTYSKEENTPAGRMQEQVPEAIKMQRYQRLMAQQEGISQAKLQMKIGTTADVLVEKRADDDDKHYLARLATQAPEVDGIVYVSGAAKLGAIQKVKITAASSYDLISEIC